MKRSTTSQRPRRGAFAPLTVILLVPLVGMLAFSIDIGYMVTTQAELQNAADAAALAGAQQLQALYNQYYLPQQSQQLAIYTTATTNTGLPASPMYMAERFAYYNQAAGVYLQVPDSDVTFSYQFPGSATQAPSYPNVFPNTVNVTTRRDNVANGPLALFFGQIFGVGQVNLTASSSATIYTGDVSTLQVIPGVNAHILPVALDVYTWKYFLSKGITWDYTYDNNGNPGGTTYTDANGNPQLKVYPNPGNAPGNFGLLDVGPPSNNTPAFRNWIDDGETPNDIQYLLTNNLLPVSPPLTEPGPQSWKCGPGLKSTLVTNFQSVIGEPNLIPLFNPVAAPTPLLPNIPYQAATGTGQGATYSVIGFVGVMVSQADGSGAAGLEIFIQPAVVVDPTAVIKPNLNGQPNLRPASPSANTQLSNFMGTNGSTVTTFVSAKLTQ